MLGSFWKISAILTGLVLLAAASPSIAADFHGRAGTVFYRQPHGDGVANRRNFDFRGRSQRQEGTRFEHRGFDDSGGDRGLTAQTDQRRHNRGYAFDQRRGDGSLYANRLPMLASRDISMRRGSGISVISRNQPDYDVVSNYAGSVDVDHNNGGTYITGYSDTGYNDGGSGQGAPTMRPRTKVIDVAKMHDACAYENGVCVIRP